MIKLVCSDLDDTLLGKKCVVTRRLQKAVQAYENIGGLFRVVTGRMTVGALPVCREIGAKGELCSFQGAVISDIETGEVYASTAFDARLAAEIGAFIEENGWYYQTYEKDVFITEKGTDFSVMYAGLSRCEYVCMGGKLSKYIRESGLRPPKLLLNAPEAEIPAIVRKLREKFGAVCLVNVSKPFIAEIVPLGVNKGLAVRFLAEKYGLKREEIVCIGDSGNDLTMLDYAGCGVVVKNGSAEAKKHADRVLDYTADEDAVARFLEEITPTLG